MKEKIVLYRFLIIGHWILDIDWKLEIDHWKFPSVVLFSLCLRILPQ